MQLSAITDSEMATAGLRVEKRQMELCVAMTSAAKGTVIAATTTCYHRASRWYLDPDRQGTTKSQFEPGIVLPLGRPTAVCFRLVTAFHAPVRRQIWEICIRAVVFMCWAEPQWRDALQFDSFMGDSRFYSVLVGLRR